MWKEFDKSSDDADQENTTPEAIDTPSWSFLVSEGCIGIDEMSYLPVFLVKGRFFIETWLWKKSVSTCHDLEQTQYPYLSVHASPEKRWRDQDGAIPICYRTDVLEIDNW